MQLHPESLVLEFILDPSPNLTNFLNPNHVLNTLISPLRGHQSTDGNSEGVCRHRMGQSGAPAGRLVGLLRLLPSRRLNTLGNIRNIWPGGGDGKHQPALARAGAPTAFFTGRPTVPDSDRVQ